MENGKNGGRRNVVPVGLHVALSCDDASEKCPVEKDAEKGTEKKRGLTGDLSVGELGDMGNGLWRFTVENVYGRETGSRARPHTAERAARTCSIRSSRVGGSRKIPGSWGWLSMVRS